MTTRISAHGSAVTLSPPGVAAAASTSVARRVLQRGAAWCAALLVAGCGGGSGGLPGLSGHVIDGPIAGATVFLDLNGNLQHDAGEPISGTTGADGAFTLQPGELTPAQRASAVLVSIVPDDARDADDNGQTLRAAGRSGFTLVSPLAAWPAGATDGVVVTPLSTLVASEILHNGRSLEEARSTVAQLVGMHGKDPLANFVATGDATARQVARVIANGLGENGRNVAERALSAGGVSATEQLRDAIVALKAQLPARLGLAGPTEIATAAATGRADANVSFSDYVVVFRNDVVNPAAAAASAAAPHGGQVRFVYETALKGFAVRLPAPAADAFVEAMARNPNVDYVEVDAAVQAFDTQSGATWGLDRTDQRALPLSGTYTYATTASNVTAYIVDTGILATHAQFGGRAVGGYSAIADAYGTSDCNGHGTHVAGTVGGAGYGMAKGVALVAVRVLDCAGSGSTSGVIAGVDWVARNGVKPGVLNLSLGGGASTAMDSAIANVVAAGFVAVVAAGNSNANACNYSPARAPAALTVGATTSTDARASYSNFGSCLDVFAPGSAITSAWYTNTTAINTISGTSMAAPHVAGLAALALAADPTALPETIASRIIGAATTGIVTAAGTGSPNRLIYADTSATPPPPAPTVTVTVGNLSGFGTLVKNGWYATATITVVNGTTPVAGATVAGSFTIGGTAVTCTTGANGTCSVRTGTLGKSVTSSTYKVNGITGSGLSYAAGTLTTVTVTRP